jgi:hypothetical protein
MDKTLNERVDELEHAVKVLKSGFEIFNKEWLCRIEVLKQPVVKVKYRNRVKPLVKKKPAIMQGKKKVGGHWEPINKGDALDKVLVSEDRVQDIGKQLDSEIVLFTQPNNGQDIIETRQK